MGSVFENNIKVDASGNATITGNLTVNGTTTTINSTTLTVDDKMIVIASGAADSSAADGAGISVDGASATILYDHTGTQWEMNKPLEVTGALSSTSTITAGTDLTVTGGDIAFGATNSTVTVTATAHDAAGANLSISAGATTAGTSNNQAGGSLTLQGGQGKGSGAGGDIIFQTANAAGSGSSLNSHATALTISDDLSSTFAGLVTMTGNTDGAHTALVLKNEDDTADSNGSVILRFDLEDTSGNAVDSGSIRVKKLNSFTSTGNTQDAKMDFYVSEDGTITRQGAFVGGSEFSFGNRNSTLNVDASSGTNTAGKTLTIRGGAGTGSGAGGSIIFKTADGGGSGSSVNSHATALTLADDLSATFAGDLAVNGDTSTFASANSQDPLLIIKNTTNDQYGARLRFVKDKGAAGAANDECGVIEFLGDDANQDQVQFAKVAAIVKTHTDGQEGGELILEVATHDGESQPGLVLSDGDAEDEVDAVIGNGTSSVTTVSGDLNVSGGDIAYGNGQDATLTVDAVSGTDTAGKDLTIKAGVGTGAGDPGDIHFQVAVPGGSGSSAQSTVPTMSMSPEGVSTFWGGTAALGNDTGVGDIVTFGTEDSSDTLAAGRLMYLHTDGKWKYCDADAVATGGTQLLGIALGTAVSDGLLIRGFFKLNSYTEGTWNEGLPCYVSEATGEIDFTAPSASGDFVRVVGYGTDTSGVIFFNPSATNIVIA